MWLFATNPISPFSKSTILRGLFSCPTLPRDNNLYLLFSNNWYKFIVLSSKEKETKFPFFNWIK